MPLLLNTALPCEKEIPFSFCSARDENAVNHDFMNDRQN